MDNSNLEMRNEKVSKLPASLGGSPISGKTKEYED